MLEIQEFQSTSGLKHLILDRDSTLILDAGYTHLAKDLFFLDGAFEALVLARELNFSVSIATNQSGVGKGYFSVKQLREFNQQLRNQVFENTGLEISWIVSCTHVEEDMCVCRKPKPGMLLELIRLSGVPREQTAFFGNANSDFLAGQSAKIYSGIAFGTTLSPAILEWSNVLDSN